MIIRKNHWTNIFLNIFRLLPPQVGATPSQIAGCTGLNAASVHKLLREMEDAKILKSVVYMRGMTPIVEYSKMAGM